MQVELRGRRRPSRVDRPGHPPTTRHRGRAKTWLVLADIATIVVATLAAAWIARRHGVREPSLVLTVVAASLVWTVCLAHEGLYRTRNVLRRRDEVQRLLRAGMLAGIALAVAGTNRHVTLPATYLAVETTAVLASLACERELARRAFRRRRCSSAARRAVVIVGANREAADLGALLTADATLGYEVVGYVTDEAPEDVEPAIRARVIGPVTRTALVAEAAGATGVVIVATAVTVETSNVLVRTLTEAGMHVELTSTLRDIVVSRLSVGEIGRFPTLYVDPVRRDGWRTVAKRTLDIAIASIALAGTAPILAVACLVVKRTSPGPALFRQTRVGKDGVRFEVLKIRTMVVDAERRRSALALLNEASGPLFKIADDPRVTRVGRLLRKTSIDELPQLWNVLRGEMSIVGPRPALPEETKHWDLPLHDRLRVKPGITGMWQVSGRSTTSFEDYARLDLLYVDNWSLHTDLSILLRTIPAVFWGRGAM